MAKQRIYIFPMKKQVQGCDCKTLLFFMCVGRFVLHNDGAQQKEHAYAAADEVSCDSQERPSAEAGCYGNRAERTRRKSSRIVSLRIVQGRFSPQLDLTELLA